MHFEFTDKQIEQFKNISNEVIIGIEHEMYFHTSKLSKENKVALSKDFN